MDDQFREMNRQAQDDERMKLEIRRRALEIQRMDMEAAQNKAAHEAQMRQMQQQIEVNRSIAAVRDDIDQKFWHSVGFQVPDYQVTFSNPNFVTWIDQRDPLTDITFRTYLDDAVNNYHAGYVVAILQEYKRGRFLAAAPSKIIATNEQNFLSELARLQPKWQKIEADPVYQGWLASADPKTGIKYLTYQQDAREKFDVSRVERIYAAFLLALPAMPSYMKDSLLPNKKLKKSV
jgi:hypothetical protein